MDLITDYRGYTLVAYPSQALVLIFAIGEDPLKSTPISTTVSVVEAHKLIDYWVEGSVR